ncbi:TonB-dependent receptor plug domain-containing protein [Acidobacteriota bacterium]
MRKLFNGRIILCLFFGIFLLCNPSSAFQANTQEKQEKKKKQEKITEEIIVEAKVPKDIPISSTTFIKKEMIATLTPRDLSEVLSFTSGTLVSSGSKNEYRLKIRGFTGQRIVLLYDGIPIYEPYYNSFDLKTLPAENVENLKVVKGASSVLYGPNALGGVVNIITKRPQPPSFSLRGLFDSNGGYGLSTSGSVRWKDILFSVSADYDESDRLKWNSGGENIPMENSDYRRRNILGKVYFYPGKKHEILLELAHYASQFGVPPVQEYYFPRYWRFNKWNRTQINLGGTFFLFKDSSLQFRSYYVRHDNILDAFTDSSFSALQWRSSYANSSYGVFMIGTVPYLSKEELKFSVNFRNDRVRIQDDIGVEWSDYTHQTISLGAENHLNIGQMWKLVGGLSLDYLKKLTGENKTSLNPIAGIKFNPSDFFDLHLTLSKKSRFPPMKYLYSTTNGNPDLRDERAMSYELGWNYKKEFSLAGALFFNRIKDLIQSIRLPDGYNTNLNIGNADISGFEIGLQKMWSWIGLSLNYTYLSGKDRDSSQPLDLLPESQFNFMVDFTVPLDMKLSVWGLAVSQSELKIKDNVVFNPGYFVLNAVIYKRVKKFEIFLKGENLLNSFYTTEPGYPMKSRTIAFGFRAEFSGIEQIN